jgi:cysteine synthase
MGKLCNSILDSIGNTPLVRLNRVVEGLAADISVKCEFLNPGGSVKDRIGRELIEDAERRGLLRPGGTLVEATSGNTGVGLAMVAALKGYRTIFVLPDKVSGEKIRTLRAFGAQVVTTPTAVSPEDPRSYYCVSRRIAEETPGAFYVNQYHNPANPLAHYRTTGPEIWQQTDGKVDGFICSVGTGGTLAGTSSFLKEKRNSIVIGCADPRGAAMYELFKHGEAKSTPGGSITEGIGLGRVTPVIRQAKVDEAYLIPDEEAVPIIYELLEHEGLCLGGSTGINVAGAIRLARQLGPGHTIVTVLCDSGNRYQSKLFNPDFMRSKNLPVPQWLERRSAISVPFEKG